MASSSGRISDAELAHARLEIDDPLAMPRLCRDKPPTELTPEIVGEYHLAADHDLVWCCHCQGHSHRNGFVITNSTEQHYLLGSECGPKHYGFTFRFAMNEQRARVKRKGVIERLLDIARSSDVVTEAIQTALRSDGLALIDQKRIELRQASEGAFTLLSTSVMNGSPLYEMVRQRDLAAEQRRDARLPDNQTGPPIYIDVRQSIGQVAGAALLRTRGDYRDKLLALREAIKRVVALHDDVTDNHKLPTLTKAVRAAEDAWTETNEALAEAEAAPTFFSSNNLARLERWSASNRYFQLSSRGDQLVVIDDKKARPPIKPLPPISLPRIPRMKAEQ